MAPTLVASRTALPPEGALRLRPGGAGSAAPAGVERALMQVARWLVTLVASRTAHPPEAAECRGSEPADAGLDGTKSGCVSQPCGLQGLRLRPGRAASAAAAGGEGTLTPLAGLLA